MPVSKRAQRVQEALHQAGIDARVVELSASTHSAQEAADALGCAVEQIAKSVVFRGRETGGLVLVVASGLNRVDETVLATALGEPVTIADPKAVREGTGFPVGGVPPIAHNQPLRTFIDQDLLSQTEIWAAAGTPNSVFRISPSDLQAVTNGEVVSF